MTTEYRMNVYFTSITLMNYFLFPKASLRIFLSDAICEKILEEEKKTRNEEILKEKFWAKNSKLKS